MNSTSMAREERARSLLLCSEEIDCPGRALEAMAAALEVPGVRSVTTYVSAQSIFVVYSGQTGERELKRALKEAGFPLLM
jgi:hypothetical protein